MRRGTSRRWTLGVVALAVLGGCSPESGGQQGGVLVLPESAAALAEPSC